MKLKIEIPSYARLVWLFLEDIRFYKSGVEELDYGSCYA